MTTHDTAKPAKPPVALATPGECIRAKWTMDGAQTLEEAAAKLEAYAAHLRRLHAAGWTLTAGVEDDYGYLTDPTGNSGYCGECLDFLDGAATCAWCAE